MSAGESTSHWKDRMPIRPSADSGLNAGGALAAAMFGSTRPGLASGSSLIWGRDGIAAIRSAIASV